MSLEENVKSQSEVKTLQTDTKFWLARWRQYPLAFLVECLNVKKTGLPLPWQVELMNNLRDFNKVAVRSGHGVGKSRALGWIIWWYMICWKNDGDGLKIPCTGPSGSNLTDVLWGEVRLVYKALPMFFRKKFEMLSDQAYCLEERESWFIRLRTARKEDPDALQGFHGNPCLFLIDEASGVADEVFEVARGALSGLGAFAVMTGNPTRSSGYFRDAFRGNIWKQMHVNDKDQLTTKTFEYPYFDALGNMEMLRVNGRVTEDYVKEMSDEFGEESNVFGTRVLGNFPMSDSNTLVRRSWFEAAKLRPKEFGDEKETKRIMGVDVAFAGENDSAFVIRHGNVFEDAETWHNDDPSACADKVFGRFNESKQAGKPIDRVYVDATGVGAGVYSILRNLGVPVTPVYVGERSPEDGGTKCQYLRDWLYWRLRNLFRDRMPVMIFDGEIEKRFGEELCAIEYRDQNGKIKLQEKRKTKNKKEFRTGSPDLADAASLTMYSDTIVKTSRKVSIIRGRKKKKAKGIANRWRIL